MTISKEIWLPAAAALALVLIVVSGLVFLREPCRDFSTGQLTIDGKSYDAAIAADSISQARGLIGCKKIPERSGMYFPYDPPQVAVFWMKGMVIPIDIVWITDGKVIGIAPNLPPEDKFAADPPRYRPQRAITGVFEIGAGKAAEYGIEVGSIVTVLR
ncbi:hypothetical protein CL628_04175 [bacterium]|nr:hypothetical protein [bacterium]